MLKLELVEKIHRNSLAKDAFWAMIGSVLGKGLSLLAGILVARFLGKELFGQYGIIKNTLVNVAVFSTLGLGYTGTRYISKCYHERQEDVFDIIKIIYRNFIGKISFFSQRKRGLINSPLSNGVQFFYYSFTKKYIFFNTFFLCEVGFLINLAVMR